MTYNHLQLHMNIGARPTTPNYAQLRYTPKVFQSLVTIFEAIDRRGAWMISRADYTWAQDGFGAQGWVYGFGDENHGDEG